MEQKIIIAGFGGQGILSAGRFLAYAGMLEDKNVSWLPSYGPEMRGGTANCCIIISDEQVGSPIVNDPTALIAMNTPFFGQV
jgi:2-oxoglutarate ferredoxin oxidoreductase subunit gamma